MQDARAPGGAAGLLGLVALSVRTRRNPPLWRVWGSRHASGPASEAGAKCSTGQWRELFETTMEGSFGRVADFEAFQHALEQLAAYSLGRTPTDRARRTSNSLVSGRSLISSGLFMAHLLSLHAGSAGRGFEGGDGIGPAGPVPLTYITQGWPTGPTEIVTRWPYAGSSSRQSSMKA